jgi:hypothetical protein
MDDLRPLSYGIITILFVLATVTILMRIYIRWYTMCVFTIDDMAMSAMLVRLSSCLLLVIELRTFKHILTHPSSGIQQFSASPSLLPSRIWQRRVREDS